MMRTVLSIVFILLLFPFICFAQNLADTSFGVSNRNDTWSNASVATLNARIADGVFAALVEPPPANYEARIGALSPMLASPCE